MIIAISGLHGTGKTTVAKLIAEKFNLKYHSTGVKFRELAKEKGLSIEELSKKAELDRNIDFEIDNKIKSYVEQGNCVVDNQLSPYLLSDIIDFCIFLKCSNDVRMKRMAKRDKHDIEKKIRETIIREESECKRFLKYYNVDLLNADNILKTFDLIIDTTFMDRYMVTRIISTAIEEFNQNKIDQ